MIAPSGFYAFLALSAVSSLPFAVSKESHGSPDTWERMHVVRRLYGEENAKARSNIRELEERMYRYQTGLAPDPEFKVQYNDHPYDTKAHRRTQGNSENSNANGRFEPIRMHFETKALDDMADSTNEAKIKWYKEVILPLTREFWEQALSVVPVSGNLRVSPADLDSRTWCGDPEFTEVPSSYISTGLANTDLILFVSGSPSQRFCQARTLAVAVACNFDQFDRPTAGAINVCLDNIELNSDGTASEAVVEDYRDVSIHEVGHVLGHSSNSYRFFYDPDTGAPRTGRPFSSRTVTCVDGTSRSQVLPGISTMVFGQREDDTRYASIVTPKVQAIARNQFNCQTLEGAPLENQPTRSDSCTGDHWDERLFYPEAMSGVISPTTNILSSLTLALMEDSGWYKANYTMTRMSPWGLGTGCDFVEQPCLTRQANAEPTVPDYSRGFFCNQDGDKGCSSELTHKMACSVIDYVYLVGQDVPEESQYFPTATKGGSRQADYCPIFSNTYSNKKAEELSCGDPQNTPAFPNSYNEVYGENSKCLVSSSGEGRCYESFCVREDMSFRFNVVGRFYKCEYDFQRHSIPLTDGTLPHTITCPRLAAACPDLFCPFNCAGRGICNYSNEVNGTLRPKCECFDPADTSEACSDSLVPDGGFLEDAGGLLDNLEENFFDPLVSVFVDHPDKWTTASWAWAAGLVAVGLILLLCVCSSLCPDRKRKDNSPGIRRRPSQGRPVASRTRSSRPTSASRPSSRQYHI
uniref:Leishmanolysin-like peptidase n=1 Tax=Entomoneis paludosa TaxID=265537 RepID=A0A7S2Y7Z5_9STRA|mmetsp:Transcript_21437/g.44706  ORF Transcript_21437/g.44706 Transcript_21437/m.44706 type:complete len:750 (+) Transcript_21437:503-2752(+)|eukprot:CAMPEP_0172451636 /NCGR_PEP_ID=MMETSP1065-20121228/9596_1 /TAXON_ID=265537 /ORGANISM="Amphiprora paludosa, Strain CCMP125" /LENGTH=749 /DNA_ID=CAMNT_0013203599 /DNA_START=494 /DNA_END=2743 /DNA_ORIENTATION=+